MMCWSCRARNTAVAGLCRDMVPAAAAAAALTGLHWRKDDELGDDGWGCGRHDIDDVAAAVN